jgi:hypothetical protein
MHRHASAAGPAPSWRHCGSPGPVTVAAAAGVTVTETGPPGGHYRRHADRTLPARCRDNPSPSPCWIGLRTQPTRPTGPAPFSSPPAVVYSAQRNGFERSGARVRVQARRAPPALPPAAPARPPSPPSRRTPAARPCRRSQRSLILARRARFNPRTARDATGEALRRLTPGRAAAGDLCVLEVAARDGEPRLPASFHSDSESGTAFRSGSTRGRGRRRRSCRTGRRRRSCRTGRRRRSFRTTPSSP